MKTRVLRTHGTTVAGSRAPAQFEEIERQHRSALLHEALRLTRGEESDAEDLVQETLLKALRYERNGSRIRDQNRRWLLTILTNTYIDGYRRRLIRPAEVPYDEVQELLSSHTVTESAPRIEAGATSLPWNEHRERFRWLFTDEVLCALSQLPEVFRSAVVLADIEGFSYREAADRLRVPLGTVMSRIHRGRARLRKELTGPLSPCLN